MAEFIGTIIAALIIGGIGTLFGIPFYIGFLACFGIIIIGANGCDW